MSGNYEITVRLTRVGQYETRILLHGQELGLSPYLLRVTAGAPFKGRAFFSSYAPRGSGAFFYLNAG